MSEILFKGKRKDNGEWVEGDLINNYDGRKFIGEIIIENYKGPCADEYEISNGLEEVIPETVGQYTGLPDKNDKKIFEGDIVKEEDCVHNGEVQIYGHKWVVYFDKGFFFGWRKGYKSCGLSKFIPNISGIEVIGNIHDNPELLKEADDE